MILAPVLTHWHQDYGSGGLPFRWYTPRRSRQVKISKTFMQVSKQPLPPTPLFSAPCHLPVSLDPPLGDPRPSPPPHRSHCGVSSWQHQGSWFLPQPWGVCPLCLVPASALQLVMCWFPLFTSIWLSSKLDSVIRFQTSESRKVQI